MRRSPGRRASALLASAVLAAGVAGVAQAQTWPARPIHLVVPFAPGGAVDAIARSVGQVMAEGLGQPLVIENRPGASANLGAEFVAKSAPDGYTVLISANGLATNMTLYSRLGYDTLRDFAPIARIGEAPVVLVVPTSVPWKSVRDLTEAARAEPGKLTYASTGNGSSNHLAGQMLMSAARVDLVHVPYKGGSPALTDLIGGRISMMLLNTIEVLPQLRAQRVRALAVASPARLTQLPDIPTMAESGLPGYDVSVWWGLLAPVKTPPEIVARLNAETVRALRTPSLVAQLAELGVVVRPGSSEQFGQFLRDEIDRWGKVIRAANIQPD
jgi:tripartite-type tricarboxylate transporter receptor subunit TctC